MLMLKALHTHRQPGTSCVGRVEGGAAVVCMGCLIKLLWRWRVCAVTAVWRLKNRSVMCTVQWRSSSLYILASVLLLHSLFLQWWRLFIYYVPNNHLYNFDLLWKKMYIVYSLFNSCHSRPNQWLLWGFSLAKMCAHETRHCAWCVKCARNNCDSRTRSVLTLCSHNTHSHGESVAGCGEAKHFYQRFINICNYNISHH